eukprot:3939554-Prymnesium_polylepis.1
MATQHASVKRLAPPLNKFIVDGFHFCEPDVRHYFLTHAHSDHTCGLQVSFDLGTIYCSPITARVLRATLGIKQKLLCTIDVGETIEVEGVAVTALDAGHCPGAIMFLLHDLSTGHRALHTGDCRASERVRHQAMRALGHAIPDGALSVAPAAAAAAAAAAASSASAALGAPVPGAAAVDDGRTSAGTPEAAVARASSAGEASGAAALDVLYLDT